MESGCDSLTHKEVLKLDLAAPVLGERRLEREADHSPPPPVQVKNVWSFTFTPKTVTYFSFLITKLPGPLTSRFFPTALIPAPWATRTSGKVSGSIDGTSSSGIPGNSVRKHCFVPHCNLTTSVDWSPS